MKLHHFITNKQLFKFKTNLQPKHKESEVLTVIINYHVTSFQYFYKQVSFWSKIRS